MDPQLEEPDLRSYLGVIARRRWLVILTTLACVGVAVAASLIPEPTYRVRAQVSTTGSNDPLAMVFDANDNIDLERQASSQLTAVGSATMRGNVAQAYDGPLTDAEVFNVTVDQVTRGDPNKTSSIVEISLVSSEPRLATDLVNTYANTYVEQRRAADQELLLTTRQRLQGLLSELETRISETREPIDAVDAQIASGQGDLARLTTERRNLEADLQPVLQPLEGQVAEIESRLGSLTIGVELATGGGAEVLGYAWTPDTPVSPNIPLNLAIGLVFGLFLGAAFAFIRDYFDDSVKTKETLERVTGVSTMGLIPKVGGGSDLVTVTNPTSPAAEAFRLLRTSVKFLGIDRQVRVVQVTSPSPGEGKTMIAVNLAIALAQAGDRVVLVGADLRRPRMEEVVDVPLTPGLTAVLIGDVTLPQAIQSVPAVPEPVGAARRLSAAEPVRAPERRAGPSADRRARSDLRRRGDRLPAGAASDRLARSRPHGRHDPARDVGQQDLEARPDARRRAAAAGGCTAGGFGAQQHVGRRHLQRRVVPLRAARQVAVGLAQRRQARPRRGRGQRSAVGR